MQKYCLLQKPYAYYSSFMVLSRYPDKHVVPLTRPCHVAKLCVMAIPVVIAKVCVSNLIT
jgi:hypothetical protein